MYRAILIAIIFILGCDSSSETPVPQKTVTEKVEEVVIPSQDFKAGMELFCTVKDLAQAPSGLVNPDVLSAFESMKPMTLALKKQRLERLLDRAKLSECAYQLLLIGQLEQERAASAAAAPLPFESAYVGEHILRVNRVNSSLTKGKATIVREGKELLLDAKVKKGKYRLAVKGKVIPKSEKEFILEGELRGVPNLSWKNVKPKEKVTKGSFLFKATKGRKFWRLYRVNGRKCACGEGCGNDFCYIDFSFLP